MPRISENQLVGVAVLGVQNNRERIDKYSREVTTGLKVSNPGDSDLSGSISQFRSTLSKVDAFKTRISRVNSMLAFQEEAFSQAEEVLIRLREIGAQGANETNGIDEREHMAQEVLHLRDQLVSLANSTYQGKYIFAGTADDTPPFTRADATDYTVPTSGLESQRWIADTSAGMNATKTVNITDDLTIDINTDGQGIFANAIYAAERLGRALAGYTTLPATGTPPVASAPTTGGVGYDFTNSFGTAFPAQTQDIKNAMDLLDQAREDEILPERISVGGKLKRLEIAESILDLTKVNTEELLDNLQNADTIESASNLSQAQSALEASFAVTSRILNLSILDYI